MEHQEHQPIRVYYSRKGTPYVWASALHRELEIKTPLSQWFPRMLEYGFVENEEYSCHNKIVESANGIKKTKFDWAVKLDMAKHIAMLQRSEKGKIIRQQLINLDKQVNNGALLTHAQMAALFDLCNVVGYFTVQEYAERKHYDYHNNPATWWEYRADIFGFSKKELQAIVEELGHKYRSQRQALMVIDKYELIRVGIIDLLMAMGRTQEYAVNVAKFAKEIARRVEPQVYDDNVPIDFKSPEEKSIIEKVKDGKSPMLLGHL